MDHRMRSRGLPALAILVASAIALSAAGAAAQSRPDRAVTIRVLDAEKRPMAGAVIELEYRWGQFVHMPFRRFPAGASRDGRYAADGRGTIVLRDPPPQPSWLVGRRDGLTGIIDLDPSYFGRADPPPLVMLPDRKVEVSVRDTNGAPVPGVEVDSSDSLAVSPARGWTGEDGVARFDVTCIDRKLYEGPRIGVIVKVDTPWGTVFPKPVPWAPSGATLIPAEINPQVVARIAVLGDSDPPAAGERTLSWLVTRRGEGFLYPSGSRRFTGSATAVAGLPPDTAMTFTISEPGRRPSSASVKLPMRNETAAVLIARGDLAASLRMRVVEASGEPVRRAGMWVFDGLVPKPEPDPESRPEPEPEPAEPDPKSSRLSVSGSRPRIEQPVLHAETDDSGCFDMEVDAAKPGGVRVRRVDLGQWSWVAPVPVQFPAVPAGERGDVTVKLADLAILAAGVVVDDADASVAGAEVTLESLPESPGVNTGWLTKVTGADGKFVFRGTGPASRPTVRAMHPSAGRSAMVEVRPQTTGLVLRLARFGTLVGRLSLAPSAGSAPLVLTIEPAGGSKLPPWRPTPDVRSITVPTDGSFAIGGLPAGRYVARVLVQDAVALTVDDLLVEPGRDTRDPRLDGVTIGGDLVEARVTVRGKGLVPIENASVKLFEAGAPAGAAPVQVKFTGPDGVARFLLPPGAKPIVAVRRVEYVPWRRPCAAFPLEVVLHPLAVVEVAIESPEPLPTTDTFGRYCVVLKRTDSPEAAPDMSREHRRWFSPPQSSVTSTEVNPGDYEVWLAPSGMLHGPFGASETNGQWLHLGAVTILEDQPPYSLRFKVSIADCRRALGLDR
jgi:hypothetical protein